MTYRSRPRLVLVDGSSYLYRAFHALPDLRTARGEPTGAIRGVLAMLKRIVQETQPDYFAVVFDAPGKTFRDDWYPEYKANRPPMPDDLAAQIEPLHELVRTSGWPLLMVEGVEADDVIGTLARQAERSGVDTVVSTGDKDLAQLVTPHVTLVNTMSGEKLDEQGVAVKFGVRPDQILDWLTLVGDSVDNIPGVPKVGPKTASKWLAEHGSLDRLVARADQVGGIVGQNLRASAEWLPRAKRLLTVKTDCDLPFGVTDLVPGDPDRGRLSELYERFEFRSWLRETRGEVEDDRRGTESTEPAAPGVAEGPASSSRRYETILDREAFDRWVDTLTAADLVCFDTETTSLDALRARLVGLAFSVEPGGACYIPLGHTYPGAPEQLPLAVVLDRLKPFFEDPARRKVGQNTKYDQHVLAGHGIAVRGIEHDTMLQSYVLESHRRHDMDDLAWRHLNVRTIQYADVASKGASQIGFEQVAIDRAAEYSAEDADITLQLHRALHPRIVADTRLDFVYARIEMPVREVLVAMERHGVLIDARLLAAHSRELGTRIVELEQRAHQLAGQPFNLASPKQVQEVLFTRMQLPVKKKTATGQPSTDEDVLDELAADYPLPKVLLEHRALAKLKSTYTDKLPQMIDPESGRVHTHYSQATAVTGRLSSNDPNLQNIPVRTPEGRRIREAFIAPSGFRIVSADYSQIELRIMAHLSEDPSLLKAFAEGADIHRATAAEIFNVPPADVTPEQRRYIKAVNFGLIYGMSAFGLARQLNVDRSAAQSFIERYFMRYPGVADYMQRVRETARRQGYVETLFGRRVWLQDIRAAGGPRRQAAERQAINAPMQGTAADLIKLAMIAVQQWIDGQRLGARLVMQVHDELVLEVPETEADAVSRELPHLMGGVVQLSVPLVVDVGVGANWDQAH